MTLVMAERCRLPWKDCMKCTDGAPGTTPSSFAAPVCRFGERLERGA
jgi:hypothetical protein